MVIPPNNTISTSSGNSGKTQTRELVERADAAKADSGASSSGKSADGSADNVSISSKALNLANIEAQVAASSEVNKAKVEELKASITAGTYKADADKIAFAILEQEDLLG